MQLKVQGLGLRELEFHGCSKSAFKPSKRRVVCVELVPMKFQKTYRMRCCRWEALRRMLLLCAMPTVVASCLAIYLLAPNITSQYLPTTNLVICNSTNDQKSIMIILEEVAEPTKEVKFNGLTLRHLQPAHTRSTPSLLPDYATSEAQHRRDALIPSSKFKLDAKSWRAALIALCVYTFLTLTIAVPIIVLVSLFLWYNVL